MVDLRRMRFLMNRLPMARFRVERAMAKATKCTPVMSGMPRGGGDGTHVEKGVELLDMAKREYSRIIGELEAMREELAPVIKLLDDPDERTAAYLRYIKGYSPAEIANGICYCERHTFRILKNAELHLENVSACQSDM